MSGAADTDMANISANELMKWALSNLWKEGKEGGYAVQHGRQPVNDFGRTRGTRSETEEGQGNFFERAFPCLFPYGTGGIEAAQTVEVSFSEHVKWALRYHDRWFRVHESFAFVAFSITQRHQALLSARLQMWRKSFESDTRVLSTITLENLAQAEEEEAQGKPIANHAIHLLRRHVYATGGRVMGSDHARYQLRSQIWGTTMMLNPPSVWLTINPCDLHDPLAQVFAGEDVCMDDLLRTIGPSKEQRAQNIARDPYAAAKFFHYIIRIILQTLFGVEVTPHQVKSKGGVLGPVSAYFGTVESQGRGSLHLHMLIWLKHAPPSHKIEALLKTSHFREKVRRYIGANFRAYLPGFETEETIRAIRSEDDVAWCRPPKPDSPNYNTLVTDLERRVARSKQLHKCELRWCLVPDKLGYY